MQYNAAISFVLAGLGLLAISFHRPRLAVVTGILVGAIGLFTLSQYAFGVNFGIDELLFRHYIAIGTSHPGRTGPNSALAFGLIGVAFLIMGWPEQTERSLLVLGLLGAIVVALGATGLLGYALASAVGGDRHDYRDLDFMASAGGVREHAYYKNNQRPINECTKRNYRPHAGTHPGAGKYGQAP